MNFEGRVVALAGGVGGAKLVDGLARVLPPEQLTVIVNTGDDFWHWGLFISPDLDTVCYTLAGLANPQTGWGRQEESFRVLENVSALGGADWFRLGDQDLATHLMRTQRLNQGDALSRITADFCRAWGVTVRVLPMSDQAVQTQVLTAEGELAFQEYFVYRQCQPAVTGFRFAGLQEALPAPGVIEFIHKADLVIFAPSNPWVSIDPILSVQGLREALQSKKVIAVSPIIGGQAVKGPAAKMFAELGWQPSALAVAQHYQDVLTGFVLDVVDAELQPQIQVICPTMQTNTWMRTIEDRQRLAAEVLKFANERP